MFRQAITRRLTPFAVVVLLALFSWNQAIHCQTVLPINAVERSTPKFITFYGEGAAQLVGLKSESEAKSAASAGFLAKIRPGVTRRVHFLFGVNIGAQDKVVPIDKFGVRQLVYPEQDNLAFTGAIYFSPLLTESTELSVFVENHYVSTNVGDSMNSTRFQVITWDAGLLCQFPHDDESNQFLFSLAPHLYVLNVVDNDLTEFRQVIERDDATGLYWGPGVKVILQMNDFFAEFNYRYLKSNEGESIDELTGSQLKLAFGVTGKFFSL